MSFMLFMVHSAFALLKIPTLNLCVFSKKTAVLFKAQNSLAHPEGVSH